MCRGRSHHDAAAARLEPHPGKAPRRVLRMLKPGTEYERFGPGTERAPRIPRGRSWYCRLPCVPQERRRVNPGGCRLLSSRLTPERVEMLRLEWGEAFLPLRFKEKAGSANALPARITW